MMLYHFDLIDKYLLHSGNHKTNQSTALHCKLALDSLSVSSKHNFHFPASMNREPLR